jgi:GalNAc-alpha-(1->4)-GalNAc-alpha-(1->3)-diNAcBac-PP-undecaprenol alpha-1,4-N-acetyl-D-galactosaminyltransferase
MERVVSVLLDEFTKAGNFDLHLVLYGRKREIFYRLPDEVQVHSPDFAFDRYPRWLATLKTLKFIRRKLLSLQPDGIINFGEPWNNLVLAACLFSWLPLFVSDRGRPDRSLGVYHNVFRKLLYPHAKGVIVQTEFAKRYYRDRMPGVSYSVIPNPIVLPENIGQPRRDPLIISVGRLITSKHHDRLIRIFHRRQDRNWRLAILGEDPLGGKVRENLEKLISELGEDGHVDLPGTVTDLSPWYRRASVFAFTSSSEGFPNALAEALSYGLPCISYNCSAGPEDLIDSGKNGFLVDVFDDDQFALVLNRLIADSSSREQIGQAGAESMQRFQSRAIAQRFLDLILPSSS